MRGWVFRIGIIAVIALGAFIFRDRLSSNAGDLKLGECFDEPAAEQEIKEVQHHPCTEAHTAEVIFLGSMSGEKDAYPTTATFGSFIESSCLPAWEAYTGKTYATEPVLSLGYLVPTQKGWTSGDRGVTCYASRDDGAVMTVSVKKTP
jgi:hypothetical protein